MEKQLFKKVLIIEEQAAARDECVRVLQNAGFDPIGAENGHVGIEYARQHFPDAIACSIAMSDLDGFSVLTALRQNPRTAIIPLTLIAPNIVRADLLRTDLHKAMALGASGYLVKPYTPQELLQSITAQLEKQRLLHSYYTGQMYIEQTYTEQTQSLENPKQTHASPTPASISSPLCQPIDTYEAPLDEALRFIIANYHQPIALSDVAQAVGYSPAYLTSLMGQRTGQTIQQWIIQHRMAAACSLLLKTDQSVEQIAGQVGYPNAVHFFRHFRRFYGTTPRAWRSNCWKSSSQLSASLH
jgi:YesN/AraC family two-component response regulator